MPSSCDGRLQNGARFPLRRTRRHVESHPRFARTGRSVPTLFRTPINNEARDLPALTRSNRVLGYPKNTTGRNPAWVTAPRLALSYCCELDARPVNVRRRGRPYLRPYARVSRAKQPGGSCGSNRTSCGLECQIWLASASVHCTCLSKVHLNFIARKVALQVGIEKITATKWARGRTALDRLLCTPRYRNHRSLVAMFRDVRDHRQSLSGYHFQSFFQHLD